MGAPRLCQRPCLPYTCLAVGRSSGKHAALPWETDKAQLVLQIVCLGPRAPSSLHVQRGDVMQPRHFTLSDTFTESLWLGLAGLIPLSPSRTSASNRYNLTDTSRAVIHRTPAEAASAAARFQWPAPLHAAVHMQDPGQLDLQQAPRVQQPRGRQGSSHTDSSAA